MLCALHAAQVALCQLSGGADKDANMAAAKEVKPSQITCLLADVCALLRFCLGVFLKY